MRLKRWVALHFQGLRVASSSDQYGTFCMQSRLQVALSVSHILLLLLFCRPKAVQTRGQIECVNDFAKFISHLWVIFASGYCKCFSSTHSPPIRSLHEPFQFRLECHENLLRMGGSKKKKKQDLLITPIERAQLINWTAFPSCNPGVALTQISAFTTHKNLAVRKIMEAMHTLEYFERKARIICEQHLISLNRLMNPVVKELFKCVIRFPIPFRWYAFLNFCTQVLIHLRTVCASPQKLARPQCNLRSVFYFVFPAITRRKPSP